MDDDIDSDDVAYLQAVMSGTRARNVLCDANADGKVDQEDVEHVRSMMSGARTDVYYIDNYQKLAKVSWPVSRIAIGFSSGAYLADLIGVTQKVVAVDSNYIKAYWSSISPHYASAMSYGTVEEDTASKYDAIIASGADVFVPGWSQKAVDAHALKVLNAVGIDQMSISTADMDVGSDISNMRTDLNVLMAAYLLQGDLPKAYRYLEWHDGILSKVGAFSDALQDKDKYDMLIARNSYGLPEQERPETIMISGLNSINNTHAEVAGALAVANHDPAITSNYVSLEDSAIARLVEKHANNGEFFYTLNIQSGISGKYDLKEVMPGDKKALDKLVPDVDVHHLGIAREVGNGTMDVLECVFMQNIMYPDAGTGLDCEKLFHEYFQEFASHDYYSGLKFDDFFVDGNDVGLRGAMPS